MCPKETCADGPQQCVLAVRTIAVEKLDVLYFVFRMETQPVCSYLEKILSKNLELMEKKLMDHIDERLLRLQEQLDRKLAVVMELLQGPHSPPAELPLRHCDSGERLSNGER